MQAGIRSRSILDGSKILDEGKGFARVEGVGRVSAEWSITVKWADVVDQLPLSRLLRVDDDVRMLGLLHYDIPWSQAVLQVTKCRMCM